MNPPLLVALQASQPPGGSLQAALSEIRSALDIAGGDPYTSCLLAALADGRPLHVQAAAASVVAPLVALLRSSTDSTAVFAARAVRYLASAGDDGLRRAIADAGALEALVALLQSRKQQAVAEAAGALAALALCPAVCESIAAAGALPPLLQLIDSYDAATDASILSSGDVGDTAAILAAQTVANMAASNCIVRNAVVAVRGLDALVALADFSAPAAQEAAAAALAALAADQRQNSAVCVSAVPALVLLADSGAPEAQAHAAGALACIAADGEPGCSQLVTFGAVKRLVMLVKSGTSAAKQRGAAALAHIAASSSAACDDMINAGVLKPLPALVSSGSDAAAKLVAALAAGSGERRDKVVAAGTLVPLVSLLTWGSLAAQEAAAKAMKAVTADSSRQLRDEIVAIRALPPLLELAMSGAASPASRVAALWALCNLSDGNEEIRTKVFGSGVVPAMVSVLSSGSDVEKEAAAGVLAALADGSDSSRDERRDLIAAAGALPPLVTALSVGCDGCKKHACIALSNIARSYWKDSIFVLALEPRRGAMLRFVGAVEALEALRQQQASSDVAAEAEKLLKLLEK